MEIDAGVDESRERECVCGGEEVKWEGRYYAAQMSCDCINLQTDSVRFLYQTGSALF